MRLRQSMSLRFLAHLTKGTFLKTLVHLSEHGELTVNRVESWVCWVAWIISDDKRDSLKRFWCGFVGKGFFSRS